MIPIIPAIALNAEQPKLIVPERSKLIGAPALILPDRRRLVEDAMMPIAALRMRKPAAAAPVGKSFLFDGTTAYMELAPSPILALPCTIVAWFNPDTDTVDRSVASVGAGTARFLLQASGATAGDPIQAFSTNAAGTTQVASAGDFAPTTWQHAAGVWATSSSRTAYYNGVAGTANVNANTADPTTFLRATIGMRYNGNVRGGFFAGKIAHVAIWNIVLTGTEIASLATPGTLPSSVHAGNLVFYADLQGGIAKDAISNTSLTVVGATSSTDGPF
jgi:hypothetical protein